jgi:very-short-patch-repair endonuclease
MGTSVVSRVEALARAQFGVLTRAQCLGLGMTPGAIKWMLHSRRWQRVHFGVFATHLGPLEWRARVSAALLFCGEGAVASHGSAARLHGLPQARRQRGVLTGGRRGRTDNDYAPFGVVVELDGRLGHEAEGIFRDRTRDNITTVSGKSTLRFGWADVAAHPCEVAQDVGLLLGSRGWRGRLKRCGVGCRVSGVATVTLKDRGCHDDHDPSP